MLESLVSKELQYQKLTPEEMKQRGILGRLTGVISDFKNPTRNGRLYSEQLWDNVFENPIMKEKIANRLCFGELGHPLEDRSEIDMEKIAICLSDYPKKDKKTGTLVGCFDILDTPNGRILKTLCDYGSAIGVSSRGEGDTYVDTDGQEKVEESTYDCVGWDAVVIPSVKSARPKFVTESYSGKSLKQALTESLNQATDDEKKIMLESLDNLGINLEEEKESSSFEDVNIDATIKNESADDDGEALVEELQNALLRIQNLQDEVGSLQEKLSVCYAKEYDYKAEIENNKKTIRNLTESSKSVESLKRRVDVLKEKLDEKNSQLVDSENALREALEKNTKIKTNYSSLRENLSNKKDLVESLNEQLKSVKSSYEEKIDYLNDQISSLNESLSTIKKDALLKNKEYNEKISKSNSLVEKYKKIAKTSVEKYIESQALKLGVNPNEIKSKLNESYTFDDIDNVCDEIQEYKIGINNLPFSFGLKKNSKIKITESKQQNPFFNEDDVIDDTLLNLAGLKK